MPNLIQVSLVSSIVAKNKKVGIIIASKKRLNKKHLVSMRIDDNIPICIGGMEEQKHFLNINLRRQPFGEVYKVEKGILLRNANYPQVVENSIA